MFSETYYSEIRQLFDRQMSLLYARRAELEGMEAKLPDGDKTLCRYSAVLLGEKLEEIEGTLDRCTGDEGEALRFLYSAMPLSDILDYPASLYLSYAKHGVFLWKEGPFAGKVPERIFANYVLHHRVNNEDIADTRGFFHDKLIDRVAGKNMYDAVVETNYWCAEKAAYRSTYMRTQNPLTMYGTALGRCGEEAPFAVTALRSLGIPARGAAAPWWSHCDDNHAWAEAWCDGRWHFLGSCEPEERLDRGWFVGPASRAMLINATWFGKDAPLEPVAARPDMSAKLNLLALYARTAKLTVRVQDEEGNPVPGARVEFSVLNYGKFGPVARLCTGKEEGRGDYGAVELDTGYGDLLVSAYADGRFGERLVSLADACGGPEGAAGAEYVVTLKKGMEGLDQWRELDFHAPGQTADNQPLTDEQTARSEACLQAAGESRRKRTQEFYREEEAERALSRFDGEDREAVKEILLKAKGNMGEIVRFLEWDFGGQTENLEQGYGRERWKLEALRTLHENDYWDIDAEVLAECSICADPYASRFPRDIFFPFLLNPCVASEKARRGRAKLFEALGEKGVEQVRNDPSCLPGKLEHLVISMPEQEYSNLVASPIGCLTGAVGSGVSREVLCVNMYRSLGIPARMRPLDRRVEYYADGAFASVGTGEAAACGKIVLHGQGALKLSDWNHYSLSRYADGHFTPLFLKPGRSKAGEESPETPSEDVVEQELEQGLYRIVTTNRVPNGNQLVNIYDFFLRENEVKQITLIMRDIPVEAMIERVSVSDFALHTLEGEEARIASLAHGGRALLLWLELTQEPTEHILNELYEKREAYAGLVSPLCFVVREGADYKANPTLARTLEALPKVRILTDGFGAEYETLCGQVKRNPGALPLALILEEGGSCVHSDAGYNVGMADTLLRFLDAGARRG